MGIYFSLLLIFASVLSNTVSCLLLLAVSCLDMILKSFQDYFKCLYSSKKRDNCVYVEPRLCR
ncbi:hypothetical protein M758_5G061100 [Ceratodon purpureus]|nr:hypothetical protein M758_5G061100 [Ceratodon purpureus]